MLADLAPLILVLVKYMGSLVGINFHENVREKVLIFPLVHGVGSSEKSTLLFLTLI